MKKSLYKIYYVISYVLIGVLVWSKLASGDHSGFECFVGAVLAPYILLSTLELIVEGL